MDGIDIRNCTGLRNCDPCMQAKSTRDPRKITHTKSTRPLDLVHADSVGPVRFASLGGSRYCIALYDDCSAFSLVRFTSTKSEASQALKHMILELENVYNSKVKRLCVRRLRTDNAKEFLSKHMKEWLSDKGIIHEKPSPHSPESNGKAERLNRTLLDMARTMMQELSHVPGYNRLWAEAMSTANYIRNRLFSSACNVAGKTPFEVITGQRPDLAHIRRFGANAYAHIPKATRKDKFGSRAVVGYLVGFDNGNSYKIYLPDKNVVIVSRDVKFDQSSPIVPALAHNARKESSGDSTVSFESTTLLDEDNEEQESGDLFDAESEQEDEFLDTTSDDGVLMDADPITHYPECTRSGRVVKPLERYCVASVSLAIVLKIRMGNEEPTVPTSYKEAMDSDAASKWQSAMDAEMADIKRNKNWVLEPPPEGVRAIGSKWVFANKTDGSGALTRRRARLVAKGFSQHIGIDYNETFASVASYTTFRALLSMIASEDLNYLQLDVRAAFFNSNHKETIYLKQPEGFVDPSQPG